MAYYRQPEFYRSFKCMGGTCPNSCCAFWRIDWTIKEVEKLKSADCSPELRKLIDESFVPRKDDKDMMSVSLQKDQNMDCPFLTEDRMCRIQRELGEEYLSHTCTFYPRTLFLSNNVVTRTCSASCYQVMETLCSDPNAVNLVNCKLEAEKVVVPAQPDSPEALKEHPELIYRNELFDFFYDIISNKNRTIETSLLLGALAAQKLTEYITLGEHDRIPEIFKALRPQLNAKTIPSFENAKINYNYCLGLVGKLVNTFKNTNILNNLTVDGHPSIEKFEQGRTIFFDYLNKKPYALRNIALNFLFEGKTPFLDTNKTIFENYCYFVSTVAAVKLIGSAIAVRDNIISDRFLIEVSFFVRGMYHSLTDIPPKIFDLLKEHDIATPAKIALILK